MGLIYPGIGFVGAAGLLAWDTHLKTCQGIKLSEEGARANPIMILKDL